LIDAGLAHVSLLANRGSVKEVEYYLRISKEVATIVRAPIMLSRVGAQMAELQSRLNKFEASLSKLAAAEADVGAAEMSGPDGVEINRIKGDLYARQEMLAEAGEMFDNATRAVQGLDAVFNASEALIPSPRKLRASLLALTAVKGKRKDGEGLGEMVLPLSLARVLRQQAWLLREAGFEDDSEQILEQIKALTAGESDVSVPLSDGLSWKAADSQAEDLYLDGRIALHEAFNHFKTDLWMSSLTESSNLISSIGYTN
jgi:separase